MASCWNSLEETHQLDKISLRDGMQIMLQNERDTRQNNRIQRLIKQANFRLKTSVSKLPSRSWRRIQPEAYLQRQQLNWSQVGTSTMV